MNVARVVTTAGDVDFQMEGVPVMLDIGQLYPNQFRGVHVLTTLKEIVDATRVFKRHTRKTNTRMLSIVLDRLIVAHAKLDDIYAARGDEWDDFMYDCFVCAILMKEVYRNVTKLPIVRCEMS